MKTSLNTILRSGAIAAVLALASAGASATSNLSANLDGGIVVTAAGGGFGANSVSAGVWQVGYDSNEFLAFCLQPTVAFHGSANTYSSAAFVASNSVKRLYEGYYKTSVADLTNGAQHARAFQLALWELNNDNGNLLSGNLRFNNLSKAVVFDANTMLVTALGTGAIHNSFKYTSLNSDGAGLVSQQMLSVSAVPEAQTWAMLVAGLGLLGFMRRRKSI